MKNSRGKDIECIAASFGIESRKNLLVEEMAELTHVICKMNRLRNNELAVSPDIQIESLEKQFIEEIADVYIVLQQVVFLAGKERIEAEIDSKIRRTFERIREQKNNPEIIQ